MILSTVIEGETQDVAKVHTAIAKEILSSGNPLKPPACIISGGETTVTIRGNGLGGRNQEFVLAAAEEIQGVESIMVLSAGTDGTDGPTDAAGAIADDMTIARAAEQQLDPAIYLKNNDSYHFFEQLDDLIKTTRLQPTEIDPAGQPLGIPTHCVEASLFMIIHQSCHLGA